MLKISEVKTKGLPKADGGYAVLPAEFCAVLPERCSCGAELEISETLCSVSCPNPKCITKVTQRLVSMLSYIGVLGMGEARCRTFLERAKLYNPYAIFAMVPDVDAARLCEGGTDEKRTLTRVMLNDVYAQLQTRREYTLGEYVKIGFLPDIQDSATALFADYSDLTLFYADLDVKGTALIAKQLGLPEDGARVMSIYNSLLTFREDLLAGIRYVTIKEPERSVNVCISVGAGVPYKSKAEFKAAVKNEFGEKVYINWVNRVSKANCDYLVCPDVNMMTTKVKQAKNNGIPILTGEELLTELRTLI